MPSLVCKFSDKSVLHSEILKTQKMNSIFVAGPHK